jgi:hypothetical protein
VELNPSLEAVSCSATQEFPNIFCNPQVYYRELKSPSLLSYPELDESRPNQDTVLHLVTKYFYGE